MNDGFAKFVDSIKCMKDLSKSEEDIEILDRALEVVNELVLVPFLTKEESLGLSIHDMCCLMAERSSLHLVSSDHLCKMLIFLDVRYPEDVRSEIWSVLNHTYKRKRNFVKLFPGLYKMII